MSLKEKISTAYVTQQAFADAVGVNVRTVKRWVDSGKIPQRSPLHREALSKLKTAYKEALSELF